MLSPSGSSWRARARAASWSSPKLRNDQSALSIFVSVVSLGLDRAVVGIQTLVENDAQAIADLHGDLARRLQEYDKDKADLGRDEALLRDLEEQRGAYERELSVDRDRESALRALEAAYRAKVVALTEVALFYGKINVMLDDLDNRVLDVQDIVNALNDPTQRITDFDERGETLVSLRETLVNFDRLLANAAPALPPVPVVDSEPPTLPAGVLIGPEP